MGLILDISPRRLEEVLYLQSTLSSTRAIRCWKRASFCRKKEYADMREKYEDDFRAAMGAEAIKNC